MHIEVHIWHVSGMTVTYDELKKAAHSGFY